MPSREFYHRYSDIIIPEAPSKLTNGLAHVEIDGAAVYLNASGLKRYANEHRSGMSFRDTIVADISPALGFNIPPESSPCGNGLAYYSELLPSTVRHPEIFLKHKSRRDSLACVVAKRAVLISLKQASEIDFSRQPDIESILLAYRELE